MCTQCTAYTCPKLQIVMCPLENNALTIVLGITIIDAVLNIFRSDMSNYFIVQQLQSLSYFVEKITEKKDDVQV